MVENRKKNRQNSHLIIHCPISKGLSEVSGASERAKGRASGPLLQSVFLAVIDHSAWGRDIGFFHLPSSPAVVSLELLVVYKRFFTYMISRRSREAVLMILGQFTFN